MIRPAATRIPKSRIIDALNNLNMKVIRRSDLDKLLSANRKEWGLSQDTTVESFIKYLTTSTPLKEIKFKFPQRTETRYTWKAPSTMEVVFSLRPGSYFSHYTAMSIHELTSQIPKTIYLNTELRPIPSTRSQLEQRSIDLAFGNAPRQTKMIAEYAGIRVCLLNGKFTGKLGVDDHLGDHGEMIRVTNIERTLIDATVRPFYAGGVTEVLNAYKASGGKASVNKIAAMLKQLDYVYPYHQAIGFYLERSEVFSRASIDLLSQFEIKHDFYLTNQLNDPEYSSRWHLFYPKGF